MYVLFCGCICKESDESCASCESEREGDQITENLGTRLTAIPIREERNERKGRREPQLKGEEAAVIFR